MTTFPSQLANRLASTIAATQRLVTTAHQRINTVTSQVNALQPAVATAQTNIAANTTAITTTTAAQTATASKVTTITAQAGSTSQIGYMPTGAWWTTHPASTSDESNFGGASNGFSTTHPIGGAPTDHWHGMNHTHDENANSALSAEINAIATQLNLITAKLINAGIL